METKKDVKDIRREQDWLVIDKEGRPNYLLVGWRDIGQMMRAVGGDMDNT